MAEITAVYQQSHEEEERSETSEDHAIWVAVSYCSIIYNNKIDWEIDMALFAGSVILYLGNPVHNNHTPPTPPAYAAATLPVSL